jgi:hypothetical protein
LVSVLQYVEGLSDRQAAAVRELRPWRDEPVVQDVNERLLALMTRN